jgi:hypothetical protein
LKFKSPPPNPFQPSKDLPEAVEVLPTIDDYRLDKVGQWRYDRLVSAGYSQSQALMLTIDRTVDLHEAVNLAHKAGPGVAYRIVS